MTDELEPTEDDYILSDSGPLGSYTAVSQYGRHLGRFASEDEAREFIRRHAKREAFYPDVWRVSDHGNYRLVGFRYE